MRETAARVPTVPCHLVPPLREAWAVQYGAIVWRLPLISHGILVRRQPGRGFLGLREATGEELWSYEGSASPQLIHGQSVMAWPETDKADLVELKTGRVVGAARLPLASEAISLDDFIVATVFEEEKGHSVYCAEAVPSRIVWMARFGKNSIQSSLCASSKAVFLGLADGSVLALSLADGREIWRTSVADLTHEELFVEGLRPGMVQGIATYFQGRVIFRVNPYYLVAFAAEDGRRVWTRRFRYAPHDGYLYDGRYYLNGGGDYYVLDPSGGVDVFSGSFEATLPKKLEGVLPHGAMLVSETHVFVGTREGFILAFERDTGKYAWSHRPKGGTGVGSYLVTANGRLYYADMSFRLYCLEEKNPTDPVLKEQRGIK